MAWCQGVLMYHHKKQTSFLSARVLFVAESCTCTVCLSCSLTLGLLFPMPQAAISTSHTGPHGCFFECSCTPELCFPQHWETLVLQQDLSNTPLAPAILQLCLCQVDLTCTKKTGLGLTESPGPQS